MRSIPVPNGVVVGCMVATLATGCDSSRRDSERAVARPVDLIELETRLASIESTVDELRNHRAILANELQYTRGLDRHDEKLINASFWPNAQASYGTLIAVDRLAAWANASHAAYATHQHHVTGLSLDIDGPFAHEEGYVLFSSDTARDVQFDTEGAATPGRVLTGTVASLGSGRYVNRYEQRDGEWKMRVHEYVHEISMRLEAVDLCATGCLGRWDESDLSYQKPLQSLSIEERSSRMRQGMSPRAPAE